MCEVVFISNKIAHNKPQIIQNNNKNVNIIRNFKINSFLEGNINRKISKKYQGFVLPLPLGFLVLPRHTYKSRNLYYL